MTVERNAIKRHTFFKNDISVCFSKKINFSIPSSVKRSHTADIARKRNFDIEIAQKFYSLRGVFSSHYTVWLGALQKYYQVNKFANPSPLVLQKASIELRTTSEEYGNTLLKIAAETGIWNCSEFANFALIEILRENALNEGYEAHVANLNDVRITTDEYHQYFNTSLKQELLKELFEQKNHDHVFVVITRNSKPEYVIDLWQIFINGRAFLGKIDDFITFLNGQLDERFVVRPIRIEDIKIMSLFGDPKNTSAASNGVGHSADQLPGYEGDSAYSPINFPC